MQGEWPPMAVGRRRRERVGVALLNSNLTRTLLRESDLCKANLQEADLD